ncbi:hypothetical protein ACU635_36565 [[Actinomadura] parvosata]|uniref:hypothetical protein n=1 Tax=[Actinomadura] parvosata TaxID=1955412 RepID=UPI00406CB4F2
MTSSVWPGRTFAILCDACNAVMAEVGTAVHDRQGVGHGHEVVRRDAGVAAVLWPNASSPGPGPAEPERQAHHVRLTGDDGMVAGMYRGRALLDERIASTGRRWFDLGRLER